MTNRKALGLNVLQHKVHKKLQPKKQLEETMVETIQKHRKLLELKKLPKAKEQNKERDNQ